MISDKYLVDGKAISWTALIDLARQVNPAYAQQDLLTTSEAAEILRGKGHTIEEINHETDKQAQGN